MTRTALPDHESPGVADLRRQLHSGDRSVADVVSSCLARIDEADGYVGAFTWLDPTALQCAETRDRELAEGRSRGPLHGTPVAIKELFDIAGAPTTYGSLVLDGRPATADAVVVRRLREAGAVIIGATRSHEFAWGLTTQHSQRGSTRNPWDLDRVPGGSSGGSAAAVAAGMVPLALATDTGGSIRVPSAFCGVAGIKPTFGRLSITGAMPLAPTLDTPGFMASSVADLVDALVATSAADPLDPATVMAELDPLAPGAFAPTTGSDDHPLAGLRIGHSPLLLEAATMTDRHRDYERALESAAGLGAEVVLVEMPPAAGFREAFAIIQMAEALAVHRDHLGTYPSRSARYGADVRERLEAAGRVDVAMLMGAMAQARRLVAALIVGLEPVDVLLTPVATVAPPMCTDPDTVDIDGVPAPLRDAVMGFTTPQNLAGMPAVIAPFGLSSDGLPVAVQVTARRGAELTALRVAAALEVRPWRGSTARC